MCTGNVDVYTHFWMDAQEHAFPNFNMNHKCRDFDAILAWQKEHAVSVEEFAKVRAPEGGKVRIMGHEFKEVFGWFEEIHPDNGVDRWGDCMNTHPKSGFGGFDFESWWNCHWFSKSS
jgi:hypothetical protein